MITLMNLKDKLDNNSRLIGLDLGSKDIGVSICDDKRKLLLHLKQFNLK